MDEGGARVLVPGYEGIRAGVKGSSTRVRGWYDGNI